MDSDILIKLNHSHFHNHHYSDYYYYHIFAELNTFNGVVAEKSDGKFISYRKHIGINNRSRHSYFIVTIVVKDKISKRQKHTNRIFRSITSTQQS